MKIFKVGFKSGNTYSVNMIYANTGNEEREAVEETAARRAARYGYKVAFMEEITESEAQSNTKKGMPYYSIDEQAERDHDPSFADTTDTTDTTDTEGENTMATTEKLTKDNKRSVKTGDVLRFRNGDEYTVGTIIDTGRGVCFTLTDNKDGKRIYAYPSSQCYGAEIIRAAEPEEDTDTTNNTEEDHTMTENILYLEKRGCDFFPNNPDCLESDVGNYRVQTPGYDIPTEDGRRYLMEFTCYDRYKYRFTSKRNGKKLKHPVRELVMTSACSLSPYWMDDNGTCWGDCKLTQRFYQNPRKYTIQNILDYVNSISTIHYDRIEFVSC